MISSVPESEEMTGHSVAVQFFATEQEVEQFEKALEKSNEPAGVSQRVELAWQLRQRDTKRALALIHDYEHWSCDASKLEGEHSSEIARVQLVRAEAKWLLGELDSARSLAESALQIFARRAELDSYRPTDSVGCADVHWLLSCIDFEEGKSDQRHANLESMIATASAVDPVRVMVAEVALAQISAFRDVSASKERWLEHFAIHANDLHPTAASAVADFLGLVASLSSDHVLAIKHRITAYNLSMMTGQLRRASVIATNIGSSFSNLNDYNAALEWMQRALDMARRCEWPARIGGALMQTADTLRGLRRLDAAADMLHEALEILTPFSASRSYAVALQYLGDVELDRYRYASALEHFQQLEQRATTLGHPVLLSDSLRGQARALSELGQADRAHRAALCALKEASSHAGYQISALRVLAQIHSHHSLPPPEGMTSASAPLHFLLLALDAASTIEDYLVPGDLLEALAHEYAKVGDTRRAYELALQGSKAREAIQSQAAENRASAMQIGHQTEKARVEAAYHKQLAQANAERAQVFERANAQLQQSNATLERLGEIGREITGNLAANAIFAALDKHVHALLDATSFTIYRLEHDGQSLMMEFGVESGQSVHLRKRRMDDPQSKVARCARERREAIVNIVPGEGTPIPGTLETLSQMFAPLLVGERLLGVMTIQSVKANAYNDREIAIFRTLCAYGAIALANAEAQAQLVLTEKMASLGQLVANVAHEINSPIGAIKSSGDNIVEALEDVFTELPRVLQLLSPIEQSLFSQLTHSGSLGSTVATSREERALRQQTSAELRELGIHDAESMAGVLVQLHAHLSVAQYLPLLRHPESNFVLQTGASVASVIKSAHNIGTAVDRVGKIVSALKSFSRVDTTHQFHDVDLTQDIETVLTLYQSQIRQGFELVREFEPIRPLRCLPDELNQVWTNLIHNALQAMNNGGTLTIGVRQLGDEVEVSIKDTGHGIPDAIRTRIFEPFFTTKPKGEGSGLGLDIVKRVVDKHRGRIEVSSEEDVGTTFRVLLPYSE